MDGVFDADPTTVAESSMKLAGRSPDPRRVRLGHEGMVRVLLFLLVVTPAYWLLRIGIRIGARRAVNDIVRGCGRQFLKTRATMFTKVNQP